MRFSSFTNLISCKSGKISILKSLIEASRAAAGGHGSTTGFVNSISLYFLSYFIQFCNASLGILVMIEVVGKVMDVIE